MTSCNPLSWCKAAHDPAFGPTQPDNYWPATTRKQATGSARGVDFDDSNITRLQSKKYGTFVRAVRKRLPINYSVIRFTRFGIERMVHFVVNGLCRNAPMLNFRLSPSSFHAD